MRSARTTRVSDRHLTEKVRMRCGDHESKTVWQTRWLVAGVQVKKAAERHGLSWFRRPREALQRRECVDSKMD